MGERNTDEIFWFYRVLQSCTTRDDDEYFSSSSSFFFLLHIMSTFVYTRIALQDNNNITRVSSNKKTRK